LKEREKEKSIRFNIKTDITREREKKHTTNQKIKQIVCTCAASFYSNSCFLPSAAAASYTARNFKWE